MTERGLYEAPDSIEEMEKRDWDAIHNAICWDAADRMNGDGVNDDKVSYLWDLADMIAEQKGVGNHGGKDGCPNCGKSSDETIYGATVCPNKKCDVAAFYPPEENNNRKDD